ncbi:MULTISPECIES: hypothetical protein [Streptomyces]|uniref:Uncharacterized protein n=1 Tax=Streptomyces siderophoricus TaxID=2802281 RepID=A0ABS1MRH7_9ACTN|nr:hypothetical protein [Streptomyces sp. 9-7]MBL1090376.1 hypothetical protein [Streptomyces sp. 9-7]
MGVLYGYYAADDDEEAARAVLRDGDRPTRSDFDDSLARFLTGLAALARRAVTRGQHLYCWICP